MDSKFQDEHTKGSLSSGRASLRLALKWTALAAVAVLVVSVAVSFAVSRPVDPQARLDRARDLIVARKSEEAMQQLRRALVEVERGHPLRLRLLMRAAQVADLHLGSTFDSEALSYYRMVGEEFPRSPEAFDAGVRIAELLAQRHEAGTLAEKQYLNVAARFPQQSGVERLLMRAAQLALEQRRHADARAHAQLVLSRYPHSEQAPEALMLIGNAWLLEGNTLEAARSYELIAERWPKTVVAARALFEAGNCRSRLADYNLAMARYIEALPEHPEPMQIQRNIERVRLRLEELRLVPTGSIRYAFGAETELPERKRTRLR